jgi:hypothetical protein
LSKEAPDNRDRYVIGAQMHPASGSTRDVGTVVYDHRHPECGSKPPGHVEQSPWRGLLESELDRRDSTPLRRPTHRHRVTLSQ